MTTQLGQFSVSLPSLTGASDKQIAYGNKCRDERIQAAAGWVIDRPQFKASPAATQDAFIAALVAVASEHSDARYWIDCNVAVGREMAIKASKIALGK